MLTRLPAVWPHTGITLGAMPPASSIPPLPPMSAPTASTTTSSVMAGASPAVLSLTSLLLLPHREGTSGAPQKWWIGDGLPAISSKLKQRILNWEYVDLAELRPLGSLEALTQDSDPQRLILTENFELSKVRKKPIKDILT